MFDRCSILRLRQLHGGPVDPAEHLRRDSNIDHRACDDEVLNETATRPTYEERATPTHALGRPRARPTTPISRRCRHPALEISRLSKDGRARRLGTGCAERLAWPTFYPLESEHAVQIHRRICRMRRNACWKSSNYRMKKTAASYAELARTRR
jgi:hypothetical protein